jgi:hypothetical protein
MVSDEGDLAWVHTRTLLTHITDGRRDQHCSVTHCNDSAMLYPLLDGKFLRENEQDLRSGRQDSI